MHTVKSLLVLINIAAGTSMLRGGYGSSSSSDLTVCPEWIHDLLFASESGLDIYDNEKRMERIIQSYERRGVDTKELKEFILQWRTDCVRPLLEWRTSSSAKEPPCSYEPLVGSWILNTQASRDFLYARSPNVSDLTFLSRSESMD